MQNDPRDLLPIRIFRVGVEQTQIGDRVFVIVRRQHQIRRRGVGDIRIQRGLLHGQLRNQGFNRLSVPWAIWQIDDNKAGACRRIGPDRE